LQKLLTPVASTPAASMDSSTSQAKLAMEAGRPLWGGFLLGGFAALAMELFLLGLWRR